MSQNDITFRILGDAGQLVGEVKVAESSVKGLAEKSNKAGKQASDGFGAARRSVQSLSQQLQAAQKWVIRLGVGMVALGNVRQVARMADQWAQVTGRLRLATKGAVDSAEAMERVYQVAQRTSSEMESTAGLVAKITGNLRDMGVESKAAFGSALGLAETINKTFVISGASAAAQSNAITQFTQSLAGGVLRAEEFNSVVENSDRLARALADGMGKSMGELRKAVNDGKVSASEMLKAIQSQADVIDAEFQQIPQTIGNAWTQLQNAVLRYVGTADQARGVSARIAQSIGWIAENLDRLVNAVVTLGTVIAVAYGQKALAYGRAWIASLKLQTGATRGLIVAQAQWAATTRASFAAARAQIGRTGIAFAGLQAAIVGWSIGKYLHDEFAWARQGGVALVSGLVKGWSWVKQVAITAWEAIKLNFLRMVGTMRNALAGFFGMFADAASALPEFMGGSALSSTLSSWADKLRTEIVPTFGDIADAAKQIHAEFEAQRAIDDELFFEQFVEAGKDVRATSNTVSDALDVLGNIASGTGEKSKEAAKKLRELLKARAEFAEENRRMEAEAAGPDAVAWYEYNLGVREAKQALREHKATLEEVEKREVNLAHVRDKALADYRKQLAELDKQRAAPAAFLEQLREENALLAMGQDARELTRRQLMVERDMREAIARAIEAGADINEEMTESLVEQARGYARLSIEIEKTTEQVEAWQNVAMRGADAFADLLADALSGSLDKSKSFWLQMRDIFRRGWHDLWRQLLDQRFVRPLQDMIARAVGNGLGQAGNTSGDGWLSLFTGGNGGGWRALLSNYQTSRASGAGVWRSLLNMLGSNAGGNGFAAAGGAGNAMSYAAMARQMYSMYPAMFGGGAAAASGAAGGYFGTLGSVGGAGVFGTGTGGAYALGGAGAAAKGSTAAASGAGAMATVAWVVAILAAMYQNAVWYKQGWDVEGQRNDMIGYSAQRSIGIGAINALVLGKDKLLRALGISGKWASILSGSSGIARLWGHRKPRVEAEGIMGSVGFDGLSGNSYADWRAKGGHFRSDKRGTVTGAVSDDISRAFALVSERAREGATELARQLGINIDSALAGVRVDIGKRELKGTQEEIQKQLEAILTEVSGKLAVETVKALGFGQLLESSIFPASEVLAALGTSIALVTGGAEKLGRALNALELADVAKLTEWFAHNAQKAGATLEAEVNRVSGVLDSYGSLIGGIDAELKTAGLNEWQKSALAIERQYREQVKQANELAKALGLSGARSEDLAKIELLRAKRMAELQKQIEKQKNDVLQGFALSEYSPLTDQQKLDEAMQQLQAAVQSGDLQAAQNLAQTALGLGRNLYASGSDYNALYAQVTGMIRDMAMPALDADDGTSMGDLAQILLDLPGEIARALLGQAAGLASTQVAPEATPPVAAPVPLPVHPVTPAPAPVPPAGGGGGRHPGMGDVQVMGDYDLTLPGGPSNGRGRLREVIDPDAWSRIEALLSRIADNSDRDAAAVLAEQLRR